MLARDAKRRAMNPLQRVMRVIQRLDHPRMFHFERQTFRRAMLNACGLCEAFLASCSIQWRSGGRLSGRQFREAVGEVLGNRKGRMRGEHDPEQAARKRGPKFLEAAFARLLFD